MPHAERTIEIAASRARCWAVLADFERWPEWQPAVERVDVLETDADGGVLVAFEADARVRRIRYRARYALRAPERMTWRLVDGDVRSGGGELRLDPLEDGRTRATYHLETDLGFYVPGLLLRRGTELLMGGVTSGLKRRAEAA